MMSQFCILVTDRLPTLGSSLQPPHAAHTGWTEANHSDGGAADVAVNPPTLGDAFVSFSERNPTSESRIP
jgi:hypothetical protein